MCSTKASAHPLPLDAPTSHPHPRAYTTPRTAPDTLPCPLHPVAAELSGAAVDSSHKYADSLEMQLPEEELARLEKEGRAVPDPLKGEPGCATLPPRHPLPGRGSMPTHGCQCGNETATAD